MFSRIVCLIFFLLFSSVSFAQNPSSSSLDWEQYKNATEGWQQWLYSLKPYWDKVAKANENLNNSTQSVLPPDEFKKDGFKKKVREAYFLYAKAIRGIEPPSELLIYHSKLVEALELSLKSTEELVRNEKLIRQISDEAKAELTQIFESHGVPQEITKEFVGIQN